MGKKYLNLKIRISKNNHKLSLSEESNTQNVVLLEAPVVSGCDGTATPSGTYRTGKWIKDKTNPSFGPKPWSKDPWGNPYGPYFLPLNNFKTGQYTTYGIHGTRGPLAGNFEKPPIPKSILGLFLGEDTAKYLYCSHGCVRISNQNIEKLMELTAQHKYIGVDTLVVVE